MNITEYIRSKPELLNLLEEHRDASLYDIVSGSDVFSYDDIIDDESLGPNTKVIYIDGDRERPWAIAEILQINDVKDVPEDRRDAWLAYMSQYQFIDAIKKNTVRKELSEDIK